MTMLIPIRDENPYRRLPFVTVLVIAANVYLYFKLSNRLLGISDDVAYRYGAVPCDLVSVCDRMSAQLRQFFPERTPLLSVITSMFMHGSIAHLAGNMLFLWVFGNNVEDRLGHLRFTAFYLVCGVAAVVAHLLVAFTSTVPIVGASGAISGILGAYFVLFPRARVLSLVPVFFFVPVETSAKFVLGMWFVMQLLYALGGFGAPRSGGGGGVAFMAHVGGFVAGWLLIRLWAPPAPRRDPTLTWFGDA